MNLRPTYDIFHVISNNERVFVDIFEYFWANLNTF